MRIRFRGALLPAILVVASNWPLSADTYPRQPAIDAQHYAFALTLAADSPRISAEARVTVRLVAAATSVELDLMSAAGGKGMTVSAVRAGDAPVTFTHSANRLRLPVPPAARPGQDVTYTIAYAGVPIEGLHVLTNIHGERVVFSENWPNHARNWLPMIDHPSDKATGELIVTAPAQFQVVSNGVIVEEVDLGNGARRTHWKQSVPISSWLYALGVARFDVHHAGVVQGVPLQTWVFPQDRLAGRQLFEETSRRAIDFFSTRVGPFPYEKLANVQAAGYAGGMENATTIFYGEKGVASGRGPVVHEIAHQWFGNSVTERDWDDVWLSEGFATYFTLLYTEHFEGRDAFVRDLERSRATIFETEKKLPGTPVVHRNLSDMKLVLNELVYQKGGWILHMLRDAVGQDAFWKGMREYYQRYRDRNASTDDLRQVFEQVSGKSLRPFFTQWLTRSGSPRLEGTWRYDAARKVVEVTVTQTQAGEPFTFPLEIAVKGATAETAATTRLSVDQAGVTGTIPVTFVPASVTFDPATTLLAEVVSIRQR
jgi:aminopeptidase N